MQRKKQESGRRPHTKMKPSGPVFIHSFITSLQLVLTWLVTGCQDDRAQPDVDRHLGSIAIGLKSRQVVAPACPTTIGGETYQTI